MEREGVREQERDEGRWVCVPRAAEKESERERESDGKREREMRACVPRAAFPAA